MELATWAEAFSMNQNHYISRFITTSDPEMIDEALLHNDSLCAMLLELRDRAEIARVAGSDVRVV